MRTPQELITKCIEPGISLLPEKMQRNRRALVVLLLTTVLQESNGTEQVQLPRTPGGKPGPAAGIAQFEKNGGLKGIMTHSSTKDTVRDLCAKFGLPFDLDALHEALKTTDDRLDIAFARLLYWADKDPLPTLGDVQGSWEYYLSNWRPGAYTNGSEEQRQALRKKWSVKYASAMEATE